MRLLTRWTMAGVGSVSGWRNAQQVATIGSSAAVRLSYQLL